MGGSVEEKRLVKYLFNESNHDVTVRPVHDNNDPLDVTIELALYQLIDIVSSLVLKGGSFGLQIDPEDGTHKDVSKFDN